MKTLEQWQKELPDYLVFHHTSDVELDNWSGVEVCWRGRWSPLETWDHGYGITSNEMRFPVWALVCAGAIFRRKKERHWEFKVEILPWGNESPYVIDGEPCANFYNFARNQGIKSATLRVDEWGGE